VINHEANHIRHKHVRKRILPIIGALSATMFSVSGLAYIVNNHPEIIGGTKSPLKAVINVCSPIATYIGLSTALGFFIRPQEQEADDTTRDEISILKGGIKYFDEIDKITDDSIMAKIFNSRLGNFLSTHPSIPHRIETLKERVTELEATATA